MQVDGGTLTCFDCNIIFIRHGQTFYNIDRILQGWDDSSRSQLTRKGKEDAVRLGHLFHSYSDEKVIVESNQNLEAAFYHGVVPKCLRKMIVSCVYTSELGRAKLTGELVSAGFKDHSPTYATRQGLNERFFGDLEKTSANEFREKVEWLSANRQLNASQIEETLDKQYNVEKIASHRDRAYSVIMDIVKENSGKTVMVVCHGGTLRTLFSLFHKQIKRYRSFNEKRGIPIELCHHSNTTAAAEGHECCLEFTHIPNLCTTSFTFVKNQLSQYNEVKDIVYVPTLQCLQNGKNTFHLPV